MRLYADSAAYAAYYPDTTAPSNLDVLLRDASRTVDKLTKGIVYDTDPATGLPTDGDVAQALSDAACAIAGEADANGTHTPGSATTYSSVTFGSVNLTGPNQGTNTPVVVDGITIPAAAIVAIRSLGDITIVTPGYVGYCRPLDRLA